MTPWWILFWCWIADVLAGLIFYRRWLSLDKQADVIAKRIKELEAILESSGQGSLGATITELYEQVPRPYETGHYDAEQRHRPDH